MNGNILYPSSGLTGNQLETLEFIGMLDAPLPQSPANLDRLPRIADGTATVEDRARAYLHANCAMCHRPNGPGQGPEDFRYWLPTAQIGAINQDPTQGDMGLAAPKLIAPGSPANSILLQRMLTLDPAFRMPPLASGVVDSQGTQLIASWIQAMPQSDVVDVVDADYDATTQVIDVRATSTQGGAALLTAYTKNNGVLDELGSLVWLPAEGVHAAAFSGVTVAPDCVAVESSGGGYDEVPVAGNCSAGPGGTPVIVPLATWLGAQGGVSASGNQVSYNGAAGQWNANSIYSESFSNLDITQPFEVRFTLSSNPAVATWVIGLGVTETGSSWRDVDFGLRNSNGVLHIYESGDYVETGSALAAGDVVSIYANAGVIEYRHNGATVHVSSYGGAPNFYVDTSFKSGAASFSVDVETLTGDPDPGDLEVTTWFGATNGVTDSGNSISFSASPQPWQATINSAPLSLFGATGEYSLTWTVGSNPASSTWVAGLGIVESSAGWRDVDFAFRGLNGVLGVLENGTWVAGGGMLSVGDQLSIAVSGTQLEFRLNDVPVYSRTISGTEDFYVDTSFKSGAITLDDFVIRDF
jgi:mono/diheme cytochrome c family protein